MNCPKCGFTQPDGMPDCQRCQVIFSKWQARQNQAAETMALPEAAPPAIPRPAPAPQAVPPPPANVAPPSPPPNDYLPQYTYIPPTRNLEPDPPKRNWGVLAALLGVAALVAWGGWVVFTPQGQGSPALEGSYRDAQYGFAFLPPPDWVPAPDSVNDAAVQNVKGVPVRVVASYVKRNSNKFDPDAIIIIVLDRQIPHLSQSDKADAEKSFTEAATKKYSGANLKLDDSSFIKVDGLQALRLASHATGVNPTTHMTLSAYLEQVMIPGNGRTFLINCIALSENNRACDESVASFRVLKRPTLAGGSLIFGGVLKAGLIGAVVGLCVGFIKWLLGGG